MATRSTQILALTEIFEDLTETEVRAMMHRVGPRAALEIPGRLASHAEVAQRAAELVVAHGALDESLLRALLELRPRSRPAIVSLAAAAGITAPSRSSARAVRGGRGVAIFVGGVALCAWAIYAGRFVACEAANERVLDPGIEAPVVAAAAREATAREATKPEGPVAPMPPVSDESQPRTQRTMTNNPRTRARAERAEVAIPPSVPLAGMDTPTRAPTAGERWTVSRVDDKRLTLSGGVLPSLGLLMLVAPADERRFVSDVQCRIEEAPGTCWLIALPGNALPRAGDVFVRAPTETR